MSGKDQRGESMASKWKLTLKINKEGYEEAKKVNNQTANYQA